MILYIHGFKSCGSGNKSRILREYFGENFVISPDLPYSPKRVISFLENIIKDNDINLLVGSSLGGYYAINLSEKFNKKCVLINPSLKPYQTLLPFVGKNRRFCDDREFIWKEEYIKEFIDIFPQKIDLKNYLVLLQSRDEVLNYSDALNIFMGSKVVVEYGGNHRFENLKDYLLMIENFMRG